MAMAFEIKNNGFSKDQYQARSARLSLLSNNISEYEKAPSLPVELYEWAKNAFGDFMSGLAEQSNRQGEKSKAFSNYHTALDELYSRYKILKHLLISNYGSGNPALTAYGIDGPTPRSKDEIIKKVSAMITRNRVQTLKVDPKALPGGDQGSHP